MVASPNAPRAASDAPPASAPGFAIRLPSAQLADLIQINCVNRIHGAFRVSSAGGEGQLFFHGGQLVHATCGGQVGLDAVVVMLGWRSGSVEPCVSSWPVHVSIGMGADALLLCAAQQLDERARRDATRDELTTKVVRRVQWPDEFSVHAAGGVLGEPDPLDWEPELAVQAHRDGRPVAGTDGVFDTDAGAMDPGAMDGRSLSAPQWREPELSSTGVGGAEPPGLSAVGSDVVGAQLVVPDRLSQVVDSSTGAGSNAADSNGAASIGAVSNGAVSNGVAPRRAARASEHSGVRPTLPIDSLARLEVTRVTPDGNIQTSRAGASTDLADTAFFCQRLASAIGEGLGLGACQAFACESAREGVVVFKGRAIVGVRGQRKDLEHVLAKVGLG